MKSELMRKISDKSAVVGIIGLGYVGLPLAIEFCRAGFQVIGFDLDVEKVDTLTEGKSYIKHIEAERICAITQSFVPTTDFSKLPTADCLIICVPTPLGTHREPDMRFVFDTTKTIEQYLRRGQLISLESTTYPGTTSEDMRAILEKKGLKAGEDFYLAYSPEREDPNNADFSTAIIPKLVGGHTPACLELALALYGSVIEKMVAVSSPSVAEAAKLLENIYRAVNIALVNELKMLFDKMGIDVWDVINAAKTKPFGFQAFYPGPGLGGHCIPIDPFYLTWKAREYAFSTRFIELAGEINSSMPEYVVQKTIAALNARKKPINGAKVLLLGVSYKKNIDDLRESPSLELLEMLITRGAQVDYSDPFFPVLPQTRKHKLAMRSVNLTPQNIKGYDCVLIATDHDDFDYEQMQKHAQLIVDTRGRYPAGANVVKG
ncbi:MAG: nucleotide sugar dehydrogenase [Deltaproteobacteria bacterium]|nr:nucleotide sugar dehydrogenase [Deltaproteobacteria bacterium]